MPLKGIRVLDLSRLLPGPFCTLILSDLGADVVKVEDPNTGDYLRLIPPGGAFYALNRGKRSLALNLKKKEGRDVFLRLLPSFDVLVESFRPGVLDRLGLGYAELSSVHPNLILCSITGYGQDGPLKERAGHDIHYLALSGVLAAGGHPSGEPVLPGVQMADLAGGGLWAAIRILAALHNKKGTHLDVSMTEGTMSFLLPWLGDFAFSGEPLRRGQNMLNGAAAFYNVYETQDKQHLAIGAIEPKFWSALCAAMGKTCDLNDLAAPSERQQELKKELQEKFGSKPLANWENELTAADTCVEPVLEMENLDSHPLHRHRKTFFTLQDAKKGPLNLLRLPLEHQPVLRPAPGHGEHTDEILAENGLSSEEIEHLHKTNAIGAIY
ncbi:MAG: CaiB/BaiF CoA-transferase family protein [Pseudomonadota bacterium]